MRAKSSKTERRSATTSVSKTLPASGDSAHPLHNFCRTERCGITLTHSVSTEFSVSQERSKTPLQMGALHLGSQEKGEALQVPLDRKLLHN